VIAGILNRQGRRTASGERFTANQVDSLRRYRGIPCFQPSTEPPQGEVVSIYKDAQILGMNTSTLHRWLAEGFIAGEQVTPGAPWQIRITEQLRARIASGSTGVSAHAGDNYEPGCVASDRIAACKARRTRSHPCHQRRP
jgi:hypothetical protein